MALTKITATNIGANAAANSIGYVPVNKAGDTFTGDVFVSGSGLKTRITDGTNYLTMGHWDGATNRIESSGGRDMLMVAYGSTQKLRLQHASTGDALIINANSHVTMPAQPRFFARSNYSSNGGPSGVYIMSNVDVNVGSNYSTATGRFTAPVAGTYYIFACALSRGSGSLNAALRINGTAIVYSEDSRSSNYGDVHPRMIRNLSAGDYVDFYCSNATYGGAYDYFGGYLLG